ncbi:hypothetical protein QYE76_048284 [Lolium multiflorum]|uniref:CCHC-type domain-containing protein n=1 Tax=Lolium multiflorum TaxID=4521 RepID=A0AAD8QIJ4_LOLMU|nr:hypothetical protein QYE76_048284 [Lolium multiflorum]
MACHTCGGKGHFKRDCPNHKVMIINEDNEYETGDDVDPNAPEDDDYDTDGEDAYPSDARTIVVSQRALNVLPSASTQRCNLFQTKALVGPDKACKVIIDGGVAAISKQGVVYQAEVEESHAGSLMGHFGLYELLLEDAVEKAGDEATFRLLVIPKPTVKLRGDKHRTRRRGAADVKMDVELDKELDMKISHGRAREERRHAREEKKSKPPKTG